MTPDPGTIEAIARAAMEIQEECSVMAVGMADDPATSMAQVNRLALHIVELAVQTLTNELAVQTRKAG